MFSSVATGEIIPGSNSIGFSPFATLFGSDWSASDPLPIAIKSAFLLSRIVVAFSLTWSPPQPITVIPV